MKCCESGLLACYGKRPVAAHFSRVRSFLFQKIKKKKLGDRLPERCTVRKSEQKTKGHRLGSLSCCVKGACCPLRWARQCSKFSRPASFIFHLKQKASGTHPENAKAPNTPYLLCVKYFFRRARISVKLCADFFHAIYPRFTMRQVFFSMLNTIALLYRSPFFSKNPCNS